MLVRVLIFGVVYAALSALCGLIQGTPGLSLTGWSVGVLGYWIAQLLIDGYRRARIVTSIVRAWTAADGASRWRGSRARLWLALFIIGHAANAHGQSVSFERGEP